MDLIIRNARLVDSPANSPAAAPTVDIGIDGGVIRAVQPGLVADGPTLDARGKLVSPGLIESHFHLDKAMIVDRVPEQPNRMIRDHMERTASVKHTFTAEDIYDRARRTLERCLLHGVTHMRTQVEVDPNVGLLGFEAISQLKKDYAWAIDIQPCVFLQEGWSGVAGADANLVSCLKRGAPVVGGAPRYDSDGPAQISRVFELAREYDVDIDFHLDGGFEVWQLDYPQVCDTTDRMGWQGRVAFGHGSKLSCMPVREQQAIGRRLAASGVSLAVLPATDLYNGGRHQEYSVMRMTTDGNTLIEQGANSTISTNNVLNPFTPYGDCSLTRIANLYANITQRYGQHDLGVCFEMISSRAAQLMRLTDYGIAVGKAADLVIWDELTPGDIVAKCALPLMAFKRGRRLFTRELPLLERH